MFFLKRPFLCYVVGGVFVAILAGALYAESITNTVSVRYQQEDVGRTTAGLQVDSRFVLVQTEKIQASGVLTPYIVHNDTVSLTQLLNVQKNAYGLSTLVAVNSSGMVLARTPTANRYGDYVFETQPWGRAAAIGKSTVSFGISRTLPLVLVAAVPLVPTSSAVAVQGAVFGGYNLDNTYAQRFKQTYLTDGSQVAFYSKEKGVVGDSFSDPGTSALIAAYFNSGSDFVQLARQEPDTILLVGRTLYSVSNVQLGGLEGTTPGGALIFTPYPAVFFYAVFLMTVLLAVLLCGLLIAHLKKRYIFLVWVVPFSSLVLFVSVVVYCHALWGKRIVILTHISHSIYNSTLSLSPDFDIISPDSVEDVTIRLDSGGEAINAVQATVQYDPHKVRIESISTDNSFCDPNLFLERSIDNTRGEVTISCLLPSPGFSAPNGIVAQLSVQPLASGNFVLSFASMTQVLANDGLGTDVLRQVTNASYDVVSPHAAAQHEPLSLFSPTHPNSTRWYNATQVRFTWPRGMEDAVAYGVDRDPNGTALENAVPSEGSLQFSVPGDGTYYIHIAPKYGSKLGPIVTKQIHVDTTPPATPAIRLSQTQTRVGDIVRARLASSDLTSGLQKNFYIKFDGGVLLPTGPELFIPLERRGAQVITVRVFDNAGNFNDASMTINVE